MTTLTVLWLPILLSAVFVFVASSVIHMMTPMHKADYGKLPDEPKLLEAMRACRLTPGQYMFPACTSMKDMATPEAKARYDLGPVGSMIVRPNGLPGMGESLLLWFLYCILVAAVSAWLTMHAVEKGPGTFALDNVWKISFGAAMLGHSLTHLVDKIWKCLSWTTAIKFVIDGAIYAAITACTFAWLWPAAV